MGEATRYQWTSLHIRKFYRISSSMLRQANMLHSNGLNMRPQPFKCRFTPRSAEIREAIEREGRQALQDLSIYDGESARVAEFFNRNK